MGYERSHAILVSSWDDIGRAHAVAVGLFRPGMVSEISPEQVNGVRSFAVFPDGSKEGWDTSEEMDAARAKLIEWLDTKRYSDGSGPYDWVEVQYGDDDGVTKVCAHSDEPSRKRPGVLEFEQELGR